ncbi:MAG TPA: hypothetical protein VE359_10270 [Vicinamibacteria bacterium]|nr:hypothetical protein [Vicinamibacteria bacterium]
MRPHAGSRFALGALVLTWIFQDWPADGADRSTEGALALRLIAASFRTPG